MELDSERADSRRRGTSGEKPSTLSPAPLGRAGAGVPAVRTSFEQQRERLGSWSGAVTVGPGN